MILFFFLFLLPPPPRLGHHRHVLSQSAGLTPPPPFFICERAAASESAIIAREGRFLEGKGKGVPFPIKNREEIKDSAAVSLDSLIRRGGGAKGHTHTHLPLEKVCPIP